MKTFFSLSLLLSILSARYQTGESPIPDNNFGYNSSIAINFGTANFELDGIFEIQTKKGIFLEFWGNSQLESYTTLNISLGIMNEISPNLVMGGGYSNYLEFNNNINHECFFGTTIKPFTIVSFIAIESDLNPNFLGIFDCNTFLHKFPIDISLSGIASNELDDNGYDFFINFSKNFKSGLSFGYAFSRERYEDQQIKIKTFTKPDGTVHTKSFMVPIATQGFFNTFTIAITF